ncbi:low molecular weight phosphatase family protein [Agromyces sp. SYSU T00194]|uniref:arsenate-mycothiol transferase ArsC n=1 Tax=Agromyces chitinivorans TaxID=3158560 RepID=UPI003393BBE2
MAGDTFDVLVVCTGNVHRSPLGAMLLGTWAGWYLPPSVRGSVRVGSAGVRAPEGASMGRRARAIAEALGGDGRPHRARQITEADIRSADLVLAASGRHRERIIELVPGALRTAFTIREAGRIAGNFRLPAAPASVAELRRVVAALAANRALGAGGDDIVDPQGKADDAYLEMAAEEVPPLAALAGLLFGMPAAEVAAYRDASYGPELLAGRDGGEAAGSGRHRG